MDNDPVFLSNRYGKHVSRSFLAEQYAKDPRDKKFILARFVTDAERSSGRRRR